MKNSLEEEDRKIFLLDYAQLDNRLHELGFKCVKTNTPDDYHYSHYNEVIDSLYGIEHFINETLNLSIRFFFSLFSSFMKEYTRMYTPCQAKTTK